MMNAVASHNMSLVNYRNRRNTLFCLVLSHIRQYAHCYACAHYRQTTTYSGCYPDVILLIAVDTVAMLLSRWLVAGCLSTTSWRVLMAVVSCLRSLGPLQTHAAGLANASKIRISPILTALCIIPLITRSCLALMALCSSWCLCATW